jgi:TIGR00255 family protein
MTGFGRGMYSTEEREYTIEIKSVNHKYTDINVRLPYVLSFLEEKIKKEVSQNVARGKIDINVTFVNNSNLGKKISINKPLAKEYIEELRKIKEENNIIDDISIMKIAKLPDILNITQDNNEEVLWEELNKALQEAIKNLLEGKEVEGKKLSEDMLQRLENINNHILEISQYSTGLIEQYVVKLKDRIKEIMQTDLIDEARISQEVVLYADKTSIEEEITRLKSHITQFRELLQSESVKKTGKRLDFIIQEMNREINTIGSKSNCLEITNLVIELKTELEDVREQVQNIE